MLFRSCLRLSPCSPPLYHAPATAIEGSDSGIWRADCADDPVDEFFRIQLSHLVPVGLSRCIICIPLCSAFCSSSCPTLDVSSSIRLRVCGGPTARSCRSRGSVALVWNAAANCDWFQGMACWTWTAPPCSLARSVTTARRWHARGWKSFAPNLTTRAWRVLIEEWTAVCWPERAD